MQLNHIYQYRTDNYNWMYTLNAYNDSICTFEIILPDGYKWPSDLTQYNITFIKWHGTEVYTDLCVITGKICDITVGGCWDPYIADVICFFADLYPINNSSTNSCHDMPFSALTNRVFPLEANPSTSTVFSSTDGVLIDYNTLSKLNILNLRRLKRYRAMSWHIVVVT